MIIMGLREDIKNIVDKDWKTKVPSQEEILRQAKLQIEIGKSTGSVALDMKAIKKIEEEKDR